MSWYNTFMPNPLHAFSAIVYLQPSQESLTFTPLTVICLPNVTQANDSERSTSRIEGCVLLMLVRILPLLDISRLSCLSAPDQISKNRQNMPNRHVGNRFGRGASTITICDTWSSLSSWHSDTTFVGLTIFRQRWDVCPIIPSTCTCEDLAGLR